MEFITVTEWVVQPGVLISGEVLITGANNATIRATVTGPQTVQLAIDFDGDGTVDQTQQL